MRKSVFATFTAAVAVAAALLLTGCERAIDMTGKPVSFAAGISDGASGPKTRVAYGVKTSGAQAIDWIEGDRITIYCAQCENKQSAVYKVQDIEKASADDMYSYAGLANAESDGTGLRWGTGDHTFYAVYPQASATAPVTTIAGNVITGTIPASQGNKGVTGTDAKVVAPDMRNMYMTAKTQVSAENVDGDVELAFKPLTTAVEFTIKNQFDDSECAMNVKSISLISDAHALNGGFKVNMDQAGLYVSPYDRPKTTLNLTGDITATDRKVTVDFGSSPVSVAYGKTLTFTFFLNPGNETAVNDLIFEIKGTNVATSEEFTRRARLENSSKEGLSFLTHQKTRISGLMVSEGVLWAIDAEPAATLTEWLTLPSKDGDVYFDVTFGTNPAE